MQRVSSCNGNIQYEYDLTYSKQMKIREKKAGEKKSQEERKERK
jgi:hypothetical protein